MLLRMKREIASSEITSKESWQAFQASRMSRRDVLSVVLRPDADIARDVRVVCQNIKCPGECQRRRFVPGENKGQDVVDNAVAVHRRAGFQHGPGIGNERRKQSECANYSVCRQHVGAAAFRFDSGQLHGCRAGSRFGAGFIVIVRSAGQPALTFETDWPG